jgi:hypothetical protein
MAMKAFDFSFVFLLGLAGLLVLGIVLAVALTKGKARWGILGAVILVVLVASLALLMHFVRERRFRETDIRDPQATEARDVAVGLRERRTARGPTPGGRDSAVEVVDASVPQKADVYPSAPLAAAGLMTDVARALESITPTNAPPPTVHLFGEAPQSVLDAAAAALRTEALVRNVEVSLGSSAATRPTSAPSGTTDAVTCEITQRSGDEQIVRAVVRGPRGQLTRSASFVDKPWAADPGRYLSNSGRHHVVARSRRLHANARLAMTGALTDAADQLLPLVRRGIRRAVANGRLNPRAEMSDARLRELLIGRIRSERLLRDQFISRSHRSYGDVWSHSLLIDASPQTMDEFAVKLGAEAVGYREARVSNWAHMALSIGGVLLLILLVYLLLNAATKGYYAWILRLMAVIVSAAVAIGVALLMA